jgi:hypothetical protein
MNVNVDNFKTLLKKSTLNFLIESVNLKISSDNIKSKMISQSNDSISILNVPNDVITGMKKTDSFEFNFLEPNTSLMPYLNLVDGEEQTSIKVQEEKIVLTTGRQKSNIYFCAQQVVSIFTMDSLRDDISYFKELNVDDDFISSFTKIKKIAPKFGKIYFTVDDNVIFIETTDKTNNFSNGVKLELDEVSFDNLSMCFDYKSVAAVMSIIGDDFVAKVAYAPEQEMGMLFFVNGGNTEMYYLMSRRDG